MGKFTSAVLLAIILCLSGSAYSQQTNPNAPATCGDGHCTPPNENHGNCPADCPSGSSGYCGDDVCGAAETWETCKRDCPPPPDTAKCGDGICSGSETHQSCPADCLPPEPPPEGEVTRDHSTHRALGNYTIGFGQPEYDPVAEFKLYKKAVIVPNKPVPKIGFNSRVMFVIDSWQNKDFWPYVVVSKTTDLNKKNEAWWSHAQQIIEAAEQYDVRLDLCIFTDYQNIKWQKFKGIAATAPWRVNTAKDNVADGDPSWLYTNWNRKLPVEANCKLISWKPDDEYNIDYYKPCGASGASFLSLVPDLAKMIYPIWKRGKLRLSIRTANEPVAVVAEDNITFDRSKGKLLDDRTENYVIQVFKKAGFKVGDHYTVINEPETLFKSVAGGNAMYWPEKTMRMYTQKNNYLMEWHNICSTKDLEFFTKGGTQSYWKNGKEGKISWKFDTKDFNASSDGCSEGAAYKKAMNAVAKTNPQNFDYKLSADYANKNGTCSYKYCWKDWDVNYDVEHFITPMEDAVWPK